MPTITAPASSANLYELVADAGRAWPHRVAVGTADRRIELSYHDLGIAVRELAGRLELLGIGPGDTIALCCDNGVDLRIAGRRGEVLGPGTPGEVCIRGAAVASGYLDDPEATAAAFVDGWPQ